MFTVRYIEVDDGNTQLLEVIHDGKKIASINTQADCAEDNSVRRLDLVSVVGTVLRAAGADVQMEAVEISWDEWMSR
jgi:hypothetical protein